MPRPRKHLRPRDYPAIEEWSANGVSEREIASQLGLAPATWRRVKRDDSRALEALERGRGREETALVGALYRAATAPKPNVVAALFLLKSRHGYIDNPVPEPPEHAVKVEINLPPPLSPREYEKVIEATPRRALKEAGVDVTRG